MDGTPNAAAETSTLIQDTKNPVPDEKDVKPTAGDINKVEICGRVMRTFSKPGFASVTIEAEPDVRSKGTVLREGSFPDVIFFGDAADNIEQKAPKGSHVRITGHYKVHRPNPDGTLPRHAKPQEICGDEIEPVRSLMEEAFGVPGDTYPSPYCRVLLTGILVDVRSPKDRIVALRISVRDAEGRASSVGGTYFTTDAGAVIQSLGIGWKIACVGTVESRRNNSGYHENFVITDIAVQSTNQAPNAGL
jgi:hypothetical protein